MTTTRTDTSKALRRGRSLFNAGSFFEAHEAWEEAWLRETGEARELLHGLIQISAGYHHAFQRGQSRGCVRLLESGLRRLENLPDSSGGLGLSAFRGAVARSLEAARAWDRGHSAGLSPNESARLGLAKGVRSV